MKIQILINNNSWALKYRKDLKKKLKNIAGRVLNKKK